MIKFCICSHTGSGNASCDESQGTRVGHGGVTCNDNKILTDRNEMVT